MEYAANDFFNVSEFNHDNPFEDNSLADYDYGNDDVAKPGSDTSALEFRNGKDMQGILWDKLNHSRDVFREMRLLEYKNYHSVEHSITDLEKECSPVEKTGTFYDFYFNTRAVKSTIMHFQLRNLVWATSKHDVYLMNNQSVFHWSATHRKVKEVLNVSGQLTPPSTSAQSQPLSRVQISTMAMKDNIIAVGGFHGELVCKRLDQPRIAFCTRLTDEENAMTNGVDFYDSPSGSTQLMTANNDCQVRIFDIADFTQLTKFSFPWPVNSTSVSPDGKLVAVLGDSVEGLLADAQSGKIVNRLLGHVDYSFASAWHPDGHVLATGSQDTTCRLWDTRNTSQPMMTLRGRMGAIRGLKFAADGKFLAAAEPADFVHVFDARNGYVSAQEIDLFGEIAGISFSPDTETLFVGVADRVYGSLLEFRRRRPLHYLDCL